MPLPSQGDHGRAKIETDATSGFDGGEQVAEAAADLEDAQSRRHPKSVIVAQQPLVVTTTFAGANGSPLVIKPTPVNHGAMVVNQNRTRGQLENWAVVGLSVVCSCFLDAPLFRSRMPRVMEMVLIDFILL